MAEDRPKSLDNLCIDFMKLYWMKSKSNAITIRGNKFPFPHMIIDLLVIITNIIYINIHLHIYVFSTKKNIG